MPRLVHELPSYSRHKSGKAHVRIHGKDHCLPGEYGSRESLKAYSELVDRILTGSADPAAAGAFADSPPDVLASSAIGFLATAWSR